RRPFDGFNLVALGSLYGLLRFTTEFFREADSSPVWLGLSLAQLFSLVLSLFSTALLLYLVRTVPGKKTPIRRKKKTKKR
ncbi:MAG: prolipoprotein diacylglyceryl transferase, partial [Firmicutes bacterium]|nr:prolipoprotein diacylglyceryl transferase [Bacillota bacterium]